MKFSLLVLASVTVSASAFTSSAFTGKAVKSGAYSASSLCMKYKVAVVGGGPSGACAAEIFAQEKGIDTVLFERKLDNAKPCGGAIPLCMVGEFGIPESVVDRKVCPIFDPTAFLRLSPAKNSIKYGSLHDVFLE
jgi:geranylgeranyl reductase